MSPRRRSLNFVECEEPGDKTTLCGLHFAVVSGQLDLSSTERTLDKEKVTFIVTILNELVYVTPTVCKNCKIVHS